MEPRASQSLRFLGNNIKGLTFLPWEPERHEETDEEQIFEELIATNSPNLIKVINMKIQEAK